LSSLAPAVPGGILDVLARIPSPTRTNALSWAVRRTPLDRSLEQVLVEEVGRCWDGVPLPQALPQLIDHARVLLARQAVEERHGALAEGPSSAGKYLHISALNPLEALLARGKGVIVLTPTYGAWSWIAPALARRGYRVGLLDLRPPEHRPKRIPTPGPGLDLRPLPASGYARELVRFASAPGHVTVALADEGCGVRWGTGTLLGRAASVGSTPFDLARRADLGLLPVFAVRMPSEHRLVVEAPIKTNPDADPDRELDRLVGKWLKLVSAHARRRPSHYFPFLLARRARRGTDPMPLFADADS